MFSKRTLVVIVISLFTLCGSLLAQDQPVYSAVINYNGIEFTYNPDIFGSVLPAYDVGTPFHTDAPYFANVAPHTTIKFSRPDPARPDTNWTADLGIYRMADIETYAEPSYKEVVKQLQSLDTRDLSAYITVGDYETPALPFMPVMNATQVFRTHPNAINFETAKGIEYYTYYTQAAEPILEGQIVYAYQGITSDGQYYLSFYMPLQTGFLETTIPSDLDWNAFHTKYAQYLKDTFALIKNADTETFTPSHTLLNSFIKSLRITDK